MNTEDLQFTPTPSSSPTIKFYKDFQTIQLLNYFFFTIHTMITSFIRMKHEVEYFSIYLVNLLLPHRKCVVNAIVFSKSYSNT